MKRYPGDAVFEPSSPKAEDRAAEQAAERRLELTKTIPETVDKITEYGLTQRLSRPVRVF